MFKSPTDPGKDNNDASVVNVMIISREKQTNFKLLKV